MHCVDLPEVDIPTRFFFFYTGPIDLENSQMYPNIGISLAVAFTDKEFALNVQTAQNVEDVRLALDEYMSNLKILPKDWPEEHKIDPPTNVNKKITDEMEEEIDEDRRYSQIDFKTFKKKSKKLNFLINQMSLFIKYEVSWTFFQSFFLACKSLWVTAKLT